MAGRKPFQPAEIVTNEYDQPHAKKVVMEITTQAATHDAQHDAAVRAVATQLGYQLPAECTDPDLIQRDIAANMRRSVEACLEVGRGLAVLKESCGHGNFVARLDVLGIDRKVAAKFMQTARKFANVSSTRLLKATDSQTKLFEMLVLDDEQIEELELTGQTGELKLDDIATMSVKELRTALRESRQTAEQKDRLISGKNEKIDILTTELDRITHGSPDEKKAAAIERETEAAQTLHAAALEMLGCIQKFDLAVSEVLALNTPAALKQGEETTVWLFQRIADIAAERGMLVDFTKVVNPKWIADLLPGAEG